VVVIVHRGFQRKSAAIALAFSLAALGPAACGGTDKGRPGAAVASTDAGDPGTSCDAAANLTLQSITDFEPAPGGSPGLKPVALCDPSIDPHHRGCMYFNYDAGQTPHDCGSPTPSAPSCVQADGEPEPDSFCLDKIDFQGAGSSVTVTQIPGTRCGVSNYAFHLSGTNVATCYDPTTLKQGWGATLQVTLNPSQMNSGQSELVVDASSWTGVSFWVRRGTGSSGGAILASVQDPYTSGPNTPPLPQGFTRPTACPTDAGTQDIDACFIQCGTAAALEPAVPSMPPLPDAQKCDPFGLGVGLTPEWRFVKLPFADVKQKGFGLPSPHGVLDTSVLVGLQLAINSGDWDVWIDDIAFYREPS
jgi:hypothetical protein